MFAQQTEENRWLRRIVGEWTFEGECMTGPGRPPQKTHGTESVRPLGDAWVVGEMVGSMPGSDAVATNIITLGYDPAKATFTGTFVSSVMNHLWLYDRGELDAQRRVLALECDGPKFGADGQPAPGTSRYRDSLELVSDNHRILRAEVRGDDGHWVHFMTTHFRRKA